MDRKKTLVLVVVFGLSVSSTLVFWKYGRALWVPVMQANAGQRTVRSVIRLFGPKAEFRLKPYFRKAGVPYPPARVVLLGLKAEKQLELWAKGPRGRFRYIRSYRIRAASGVAGPKLREGDRQVPEGFYKLIWLHPNSSYHLSIKINYPNPFDWKNARREKRRHPGSNIFIHGRAVSIGCLAMGDRAIEELFVMMGRLGVRRGRIVIAPKDPRIHQLQPPPHSKPWVRGLYRRITRAFGKFRKKKHAPSRRRKTRE